MADQYINKFDNSLGITNAQIGGLMADFSGLNHLDRIVDSVLRKLIASDRVRTNVGLVKSGNVTMEQFDGWFAEVIRIELGKTLGIVRNKAVKAARAGGAGSASSAVLRRMYRDEFKGAIHSLGNRERISSKRRAVEEPHGGVSGIRRIRTVSKVTKRNREYFGPDRSFILRFLEGGTDVRTAAPSGPTGRHSKATYGARGNISPRSFFHSLKSDMEQAANELGMTLKEHVEKWVQTNFEEIQ